jgi:hypothetical protein
LIKKDPRKGKKHFPEDKAPRFNWSHSMLVCDVLLYMMILWCVIGLLCMWVLDDMWIMLWFCGLGDWGCVCVILVNCVVSICFGSCCHTDCFGVGLNIPHVVCAESSWESSWIEDEIFITTTSSLGSVLVTSGNIPGSITCKLIKYVLGTYIQYLYISLSPYPSDIYFTASSTGNSSCSIITVLSRDFVSFSTNEFQILSSTGIIRN